VREVIVYTTERCAFCTRVKMLLRSREIEFREESLSGKPEAVVELAERTGMRTLPQVLIDGILVGGYQETVAADRSGLLADLLAASGQMRESAAREAEDR
jgi:glutaredoxin 3